MSKGLSMITEEMAEKANDFIRDFAEKFAHAKAERVYLEEFKKSKKAMLFAKKNGTVAERENFAFAHPEYLKLIESIRIAVEREETIRYQIEAAKLKIDMYRTQESSRRGGF